MGNKRPIKTMGLRTPKSQSMPGSSTAHKSPDGSVKGKAGAPRPERMKRPNIGTK